jgi:hypothetical protein
VNDYDPSGSNPKVPGSRPGRPTKSEIKETPSRYARLQDRSNNCLDRVEELPIIICLSVRGASRCEQVRREHALVVLRKQAVHLRRCERFRKVVTLSELTAK